MREVQPGMRIVSLTCSNTEIVAALGRADDLVGLDDHSDWPPDVVDRLPRVGPDLDIDLDAVEALRPDLVLASLTVPGHETVVEGLELRGIPHLTPSPTSVEDICTDILAIAAALGEEERGGELVRALREGLAPDPSADEPDAPRILIQWWPRPVIAPGGRSWATEAIRAAGGVNPIGSEDVPSRPLEDAQVALLAPDAIVVAWCGVHPDKYRTDVVARNPAFADTPAVRNGQLHRIPEAYLGRPGPRLLTGVQALRAVVQGVRTGRAPGRSGVIPLLLGLLMVGAAGCGPADDPPPPPQAEAPATGWSFAPDDPARGFPGGPSAGIPALPIAGVTVRAEGLAFPVAAVFAPGPDLFLVAGGGEGSGVAPYVSRVLPDGEVAEVRWIDGGAPGSRLVQPTALALSGDTLIVVDGACLRYFRLEGGRAAGERCLPGDEPILALTLGEGDWAFLSRSGGPEGEGSLWFRGPGDSDFSPVGPAGAIPGGIGGLVAGNPGTVTGTASASGRVFRLELRDGRWIGPFDLWTPAAPAGRSLLQLRDGALLASTDGGILRLGVDGSIREVFRLTTPPGKSALDPSRGRILTPLPLADELLLHNAP